MLHSELSKIMVNEVTFVVLAGAIAPIGSPGSATGGTKPLPPKTRPGWEQVPFSRRKWKLIYQRCSPLSLLFLPRPCKLVLQRSHHTHVVRKSCRSFPLHCIVASVCGFCNLGERKIFRMKLQKHLQIQEISQTVKNQKPSVLLRILL